MALKAALPFISAGLSAVGAFQQSQQASATANYNARVAEANAVSTRQWAEYEASRVQQAGKTQRARMLAAQGASGVATGTGSFLDVLTSDAIENELDALSMRLQGQQRGQFYDAQGAGYRMQASQARSSMPFSIATAGLRGYTSAIRWSGPRVGVV